MDTAKRNGKSKFKTLLQLIAEEQPKGSFNGSWGQALDPQHREQLIRIGYRAPPELDEERHEVFLRLALLYLQLRVARYARREERPQFAGGVLPVLRREVGKGGDAALLLELGAVSELPQAGGVLQRADEELAEAEVESGILARCEENVLLAV